MEVDNQTQVPQAAASSSEVFRLRVATYNILNTSDRYDEREKLLKNNLYELNADVLGLQEVAFGSA
jgi:mRNA deadenylase 3'-5' endonuclease subunit Ccr4